MWFQGRKTEETQCDPNATSENQRTTETVEVTTTKLIFRRSHSFRHDASLNTVDTSHGGGSLFTVSTCRSHPSKWQIQIFGVSTVVEASIGCTCTCESLRRVSSLCSLPACTFSSESQRDSAWRFVFGVCICALLKSITPAPLIHKPRHDTHH